MNPEKLRQNFLAYIKDQFDKTIEFNRFESVCLDESTALAINTTENNLPITLSYPFPDLMKFVFQHWQATVKSFFEVYPVGVQANMKFRGVNIPVDRSSREQTIQLLDQLNSLFES